MLLKRVCRFAALSLFAVVLVGISLAWTPLPVEDDPLVRLPGTQPGQGVSLEGPHRCLNCHGDYDHAVEPGFSWKGSMMAQAARDFIFWKCMTVAAQESIWAGGTPNACDICERCHFPEGWLENRSDPPNATAMTGSDYDGVHCDFCHQMWNPFFEDTYSGVREGSDWVDYWDEAGGLSQPMADETYQEDMLQSHAMLLFNGSPFFGPDNRPSSAAYIENGAGQFFVSTGGEKRSSYADANAKHQMLYSRYNKSKYYCSSCHDVSNPVLANLGQSGNDPLTTETDPAFSYYHVERTFSEFMLSDYAIQGGTPGIGPFAPDVFETSYPNNYVAKCQDCHMKDVVGYGCNKNGIPLRPDESTEHPNSGLPLHDLTGGNAWVTAVLASAVPGSANHDPVNEQLLSQGPAVLTLDLTQGEGLDAEALLAGADRAMLQLKMAAAIEDIEIEPIENELSFRIQNQTGHKLISGFPEGRRMFVNVKVWSGNALIHEVNPYDYTVGTLKGLPPEYSPNSPPLGPDEIHLDELVYEIHPRSDLTGEDETFHIALATGRYKDNRIPPMGFRIDDAPARLCEPVWHGVSDPGYFSDEEYAGGYDEVEIDIPSGGDRAEITLYYQTTSREYVEFLRDEINGVGDTLSSPTPSGEPEAYIIQTDPFFSQLKAWGDTMWQLWEHNMNVPGAAPFVMVQASFDLPSGNPLPAPAAPPPQNLKPPK